MARYCSRCVSLPQQDFVLRCPTRASTTANPSTHHDSKWALEAISDAARLELAEHGVSVSVVQPAYVRSEIFGKQIEKNDFHQLYGHVLPDPDFSRQCIEKASEPTVTSDAIMHALTSPYPRTRYVRRSIARSMLTITDTQCVLLFEA